MVHQIACQRVTQYWKYVYSIENVVLHSCCCLHRSYLKMQWVIKRSTKTHPSNHKHQTGNERYYFTSQGNLKVVYPQIGGVVNQIYLIWEMLSLSKNSMQKKRCSPHTEMCKLPNKSLVWNINNPGVILYHVISFLFCLYSLLCVHKAWQRPCRSKHNYQELASFTVLTTSFFSLCGQNIRNTGNCSDSEFKSSSPLAVPAFPVWGFAAFTCRTFN